MQTRLSPFLLTALLLVGLLLPVQSVYASGAPSDEMVQNLPTDTLSLTVDQGQVLQLATPANSVFVANPDVADVQVKSGNVLYIYGRAPGQTSFYAVDADDKIIASRTVVVGLNIPSLRAAIRQLSGTERVRASQVQDMIMLSGQVDNVSIAEDVVRIAVRHLPRTLVEGATTELASDDLARAMIMNRMQIMGNNQVNIRVRIAEVRRDRIKTLGIGAEVDNPELFGDVDMSFGFDPSVSLAGAGGAVGAATTWGATSISANLDALVEDGYANLLAEPNLTALSGETASFLAGGEFPVPTPDADGGTTILFREYGVRLSFTPTVVNGDRISLRVRPEVSERDDAGAVSFAGGSIPGLTTRRAETSIELGSGQSFSIAGLLQNNVSQSVDKFPGLGDIPVLGALFRSDRFRQNETELVIVVTPYLVKPVSANKITLPTDGFLPPNDVDRWIGGRMNSEKPVPAPVPVAKAVEVTGQDGALAGDIGFVVQ
jgi:pilus assembly protein CpaC